VCSILLVFVTAPPPPRKTRGELMKDIDADYYGYRDEDDGVIIPLEKEAEKKGLKLYINIK
jgi:pre-mRNA-splicing factor ISY1